MSRFEKFFGSLLFWTLLFNIVDAALTVAFIPLCFDEGNPVMSKFLEAGPVPFIAAKTCFIGFGSLVLWTTWKNYRHPLALFGVYLCFIVYWALVIYFWMALCALGGMGLYE